MYMVFFNATAGVSRTDPIDSYDAAIDAAKTGPSGAKFFVTDISDPNNYNIVTQGTVA